jgi:hypothetical protein
MSPQQDLFALLTPPCAECPQLDPQPINPGVHYCHGFMTWQLADARVEGCRYRGRPPMRAAFNGATEVEAIRDLLESPRHNISAKDRKRLLAELRAAERAACPPNPDRTTLLISQPAQQATPRSPYRRNP